MDLSKLLKPEDDVVENIVLKDNNLKVSSYGAGAQVKIPGFKGARVFPFGTPYDSIYKSLESENEKFYKQNGMLDMNDRNRNIKKSCVPFCEGPGWWKQGPKAGEYLKR